MLQIKRWHLMFFFITLIAIVAMGCSASNSDQADSTSSSAQGNSKQLAAESSSVKPQASTAESGTAVPTGALGSSGSSIGQIAVAGNEGFNQKLIYKANLTMEVVTYDEAASELRNAIHQSGGYILQFEDGQYGGEQGSTYTIKVPAASFMDFIDRLEGIEHKRFERQVSGTDVTEEYVDLESRLKAKQLVEERLLGFMDKAQKADDLVKFSQQLSGVQEEIEQIKGRIRYLDQNVAYSTIELRMYQPSAAAADVIKPATLGGKMSSAVKGSVDTLIIVVQGLLIFLSGALPVLLFLLLIAIPATAIWRYLRRRGSGSTKRNLDKSSENDGNDNQ